MYTIQNYILQCLSSGTCKECKCYCHLNTIWATIVAGVYHSLTCTITEIPWSFSPPIQREKKRGLYHCSLYSLHTITFNVLEMMIVLDHHLLTYTLLALKSTEGAFFTDKFWYLPILYCYCWEFLIYLLIFLLLVVADNCWLFHMYWYLLTCLL